MVEHDGVRFSVGLTFFECLTCGWTHRGHGAGSMPDGCPNCPPSEPVGVVSKVDEETGCVTIETGWVRVDDDGA